MGFKDPNCQGLILLVFALSFLVFRDRLHLENRLNDVYLADYTQDPLEKLSYFFSFILNNS